MTALATAAAIGVAVVIAWLGVGVARSLRRGDVGVDLIAVLAMAAALAIGEILAAAIVALMLAGGNALERAATRRARRELSALVERAPRIAHRRVGDGFEEVPVAVVSAGDVVLVRGGEVVPVDGEALGTAVVDESALTGEPLPVTRHASEPVRSGVANAGDAFEVRATASAALSSYAAVVRLVQAAEGERAPFVRLADRYAVWFLAITIATAGAAFAASGDPVRAVAVLVIATPCPLILAAPIALLSGLSRAARRGIVVKGGGVIERLGTVRTVLFDKTGTLTRGTPTVEDVRAADGFGAGEVLRLAASLEQASAHVMAEAVVHAAESRGLVLERPLSSSEEAGRGIAGVVGSHRVVLGGAGYLRAAGYAVAIDNRGAPRSAILVGIDGHVAGEIVIGDELRGDAESLVPALRAAGVRHVAMVSGDHRAVAEAIGARVGVDAVYSDQSPADKVAVVRAIRADPELAPVLMVGDGINDAPALAAADVGIALAAATGATISSETADAVITVDRIDRVADAVSIGRRSMKIARQSVLVGMALSFAGMVAAALGYLPPIAGALLQEAIDVAVILNALRALRG